jgi:hypothetical protein
LDSQLQSNIQFRKEVAERVGLGFTLPSRKAVVHRVDREGKKRQMFI